MKKPFIILGAAAILLGTASAAIACPLHDGVKKSAAQGDENVSESAQASAAGN